MKGYFWRHGLGEGAPVRGIGLTRLEYQSIISVQLQVAEVPAQYTY
jgi:hypothetical protein